MFARLHCAIASVAALVAAPASPAQPPTIPPAVDPHGATSPAAANLPAGKARSAADREIVVTAPDRTRRQAVRAAARAVSRPIDGQIARFNDPACPMVEGMAAYHAGIVEGRIRRTAAAIGVPVGKPGCRPNVIVMIVEDGRALLRGVEHAAPGALAALSAGERRRLLDDPGPVHVLNLTELRGSQGERRGSGASSLLGTNLQGQSSMQIHEVSIINLSTRQDLTGSLLLIDSAALLGKSLKQIGDYATMRTLARTDPDRGRGSIESILGLFDDAAPPTEITDFDRAYLHALYRVPANQRAATQIGQITSSIDRRMPPDDKAR